MIPVQNNPDTLLSKFTQLWFACYFERKLTRQKVCEADLNQIVGDMVSYFCRDSDRVDFRRATPLLTGLHNLFVKRLGLLVRDTENILKEMTDPVIKVEAQQQQPRQRGEQRPRPDNFKLNPKSFEWFLEGIDQSKLDALQNKLEQTMMRDNEHQVGN
jgi:hypothetical protein